MDLKEALEIFEIEDDISISLIKNKYRSFQKMLHPDKSENSNIEKLNKINEAYKFLIKFLEEFPIPLNILLEHISDEERLKKRFSRDWLSGKEI